MQPITRLVAVQFLLAFADNAVKAGFGFFITFQGHQLWGLPADVGLMIAALALASPYFLFAGTGGVVASIVPRASVIEWSRLTEIPLSLIAGAAIVFQSSTLLLACLFVYSIQSTFFTTAKLAYLPQLAGRERLIPANARIQTATLGGILCGLIFGGVTIGNGQTWAFAGAMPAAAVIGYALARSLPKIAVGAGGAWSAKDLNPLFAAANALATVFRSRTAGTLAIAITWFWMIGLILTSLLPDVAQRQMNISANAANALIGAFVVGIALGGYLVSALTKGRLTAAYSPLAAVGMAVFCVELSFAVDAFPASAGAPASIAGFVSTAAGVRILADLVALATFGALFLAPLYALLQTIADGGELTARVSGSVTLDALANTIVAGLLAVLFAAGLTFGWLLAALAVVNVAVAALLFSARRLRP